MFRARATELSEKKPEIRYKPLEDSASMPAIQAAILENLSQYVKPGGVIVYSTCTVLERENEDVVKAFFERTRRIFGRELYAPKRRNRRRRIYDILAGCSRHRRIFVSKLRRNK